MSSRFACCALVTLLCLPLGLGCQDSTPFVPPDQPNETDPIKEDPNPDDPNPDNPKPDDPKPDDPEPEFTDPENPLDQPCTVDDDCDSGFCIDTSKGKICTRPCLEDCPAPFECKMLVNDAGQPLALCVDPFLNLCNPCTKHLECNQVASNHPNFCLSAGAPGSFCALNCEKDAESCPEGYACQEVEDANGAKSAQCLPTSDGCNCNAFGKSTGIGTECIALNEFGGCPGFRVCSESGLDACEGPEAQEEVCNGIDDDCDGLVDETANDGSCTITNDFGSCPGVIPCGDEGLSCVGPTPKKESCNGTDDNCDGDIDEDFPDMDGDGVADCVDFDLDGDGTDNAVDCDPTDPNKHLGAEEVCNGTDDDCDGLVDEEDAIGCTAFYLDLDGDKHGDPDSDTRCFCWDFGNPVEFYTAKTADDCDDLDAQAYPGAPEQCNGKDDNCNLEIDEAQANTACEISNAFGSCAGQLICNQGGWTCVGQTPTAEVCNKVDDDCDGEVDEDLPDFDLDGIPNCYDPDDDNDGFFDPVDCGPLDPTTYPGANEVCDGVDNDCNGVSDDPGAQGCFDHYQDADGDGFGSSYVDAMCLCSPDTFTFYTVTVSGDCKDIDPTIYPTAPEECDGIDQDCDGEVDEGVSSPCGDCSEACVFGQGEGEAFDFDISPETTVGMSKTEDGGLTLDSSQLSLPFIWIANSGEGTVSKLNTKTGCEEARYKVCNDPSRTAVDLDGNGIIACRGDGGVAKIAVFLNDCIDKNGNGTIETSTDVNGNCTVNGAEMVGNDECVLWQVYPDGGTVARAAGVDKNNDIWIGFHSSNRIRKLDGDTGQSLKSFSLTGRPYGLAIDADGFIFYASRSGVHGVGKVHPENGEVNWYPAPGDPYGIAIDPYGFIWIALYGHSAIARLDPDNGSWWNSGNLGWGGTRGVAISVIHAPNGLIQESRVYTAHSSTGRVSVLDAATKQHLGAIDLGNPGACPVGVAIDSTNHIWTVNQCASTANKIDPETWEVEFTKSVGSNPYTYSDMTGYALKTITAPVGVYRTVINGWSGSQTLWDRIIVDATLPKEGVTWLDVYYRYASTEETLDDAEWQGPFGPYPPDTFPLEVGITANHLEVELRFYTDEPAVLPTLHALKVIAFKK